MLTKVLIKAVAAGTAITAAQLLAARAWQKPLSNAPIQAVENAIDTALDKVDPNLPEHTQRAWRHGALTATKAVWTALTFRAVMTTSARFFGVWTLGATVLPVLRFFPPLRWLAKRELAAALLRQAAYAGAALLVYRRLSREAAEEA